MMHKTFLSVILIIDRYDTRAEIELLIKNIAEYLENNFTHYEIIIAENGVSFDWSGFDLKMEQRQNCFILSFASEIGFDLAVLASFERANGDYAAIFNKTLGNNLDLLSTMFETAQTGFDVVALRDRKRARRLSLSSLAFFWFMRQAGGINIDSRLRKEAMVSRRALNWMSRYRSRNLYIGGILASPEYQTAFIDVDIGQHGRPRGAAESRRLAWTMLSRITQVPVQIASVGISFLTIALLGLIANAFTVRLFGYDLLLRPAVVVPGWTSLIITMSVGLLLTNITLYAMLRVLLVISEDVRSEPLYIVRAYRRI